jgi:hypothetical protein
VINTFWLLAIVVFFVGIQLLFSKNIVKRRGLLIFNILFVVFALVMHWSNSSQQVLVFLFFVMSIFISFAFMTVGTAKRKRITFAARQEVKDFWYWFSSVVFPTMVILTILHGIGVR